MRAVNILGSKGFHLVTRACCIKVTFTLSEREHETEFISLIFVASQCER